MRKNSFGKNVVAFLTVIGIFVFIGMIGQARESKCIKSGCDNKRASGSNYCYLHKPYGSKSSSSGNSSTTKKKAYESYDDGYDDIYMDGDYDDERYRTDSDYADGVDDAMDDSDG